MMTSTVNKLFYAAMLMAALVYTADASVKVKGKGKAKGNQGRRT